MSTYTTVERFLSGTRHPGKKTIRKSTRTIPEKECRVERVRDHYRGGRGWTKIEDRSDYPTLPWDPLPH